MRCWFCIEISGTMRNRFLSFVSACDFCESWKLSPRNRNEIGILIQLSCQCQPASQFRYLCSPFFFCSIAIGIVHLRFMIENKSNKWSDFSITQNNWITTELASTLIHKWYTRLLCASSKFDLSLVWHQDCVFCLLTSGKVHHLFWRVEISKNRFMTRYGWKLLSSVSVIVYDWFLCNVIPWYPQRKWTDVDLFSVVHLRWRHSKMCFACAVQCVHSVIRVKWTIAPDHISNRIILLSAILLLARYIIQRERRTLYGTLLLRRYKIQLCGFGSVIIS